MCVCGGVVGLGVVGGGGLSLHVHQQVSSPDVTVRWQLRGRGRGAERRARPSARLAPHPPKCPLAPLRPTPLL